MLTRQRLEVESNSHEVRPLTTTNNGNNSKDASSKFIRRFLRNQYSQSASPPNFVWILILIALLGLIEIYSREKSDESAVKGMVKTIPLVLTNNNNNRRRLHLQRRPCHSSIERIHILHSQISLRTNMDQFPSSQLGQKTTPPPKIESEIPPNERICFVHVGKAGGSSVGCSLGFSLHCSNTSHVMEGLLPRRTTRIFHADTYDCYDDSAFFLFVVRDPVKRIQSDFLYERPPNEFILKKKFPEYYQRRKEYYLDCPFRTMEDVVRYGLLKNSSAREECKMRAFTSLWGTKHFMCHHYFNYQFHLEGLPQDARILVIRNEVWACLWIVFVDCFCPIKGMYCMLLPPELLLLLFDSSKSCSFLCMVSYTRRQHLVQDWNGVEHFIGGQSDIIPPNSTLAKMNVNKNPQAEQDKNLSPASQRIVCAQLCNEIVTYKKILRRALNLNPSDVRETMEELRLQCPEMADVEEGECKLPMPDIKEKLVNTRGYRYVVMQGSYEYNKNKLETQNHYYEKDEVKEGEMSNVKDESDAAVAEDLEDDDDYELPYSGT
ncbi:hypothetical protein HJC23_013205 [Cyclotella cryptica]|uniref:Sulfotransferase n=1 Tax=Cyclotella cryptica TaxID=29204 RepID=A0ABD3QC79_9STRA|eukprot:CCRYP_006625-RA/>CCRYP_006625-RA protein AED:0.12 eAED:0.13 QI:0/-1/0/1/-1/1/1/0/547